ncbi:MAG: alpha-amylase, partial [Anaerolineae bacterium]|nr:alpha-amylase [Anaerolineae bacterium]
MSRARWWVFLLISVLLAGCIVPPITPPTIPAPTPTPTAGPTPTAAPTALPESPLRWWNDTVFYEVFVRSFYDSDGDGVGDLNGLIEKLDYLNDGDPSTTDDLGITGIWLMPIMESPSYHGYDVVDYYHVDRDYGTNEDFCRLMAEAHRRGIRVIIDMELNHTSSQHPWFQSARSDPHSPYRDFYIWSDEDPGYKGPWGQRVWHRTATGYYYGIFWEGMP